MTSKTALARKGGTSGSGGAERTDAMPLRYGDDPYVWACWLYYEDGMTQGEIADTMGVSRATVNSYLADAREKGIVRISLDPARLASLTVAQQLKSHFGLVDCLVVPSDESGRPLIERLGVAGAQALPSLLKSGDTLAVAWGRTILSVGEHMKPAALRDMTVVQATGGMNATFAYTPELCAAKIADTLDARCVNLTAPAIVASRALRELLLDEPLLKEQFATLEQANRIIFGISSLRPNSTIHTSGLLEPTLLQHYLAHGVAGVVAGRFIDEKGRPVHGPLDDRTVGISLDNLSRIGTRVGVAGGFDKVPALLAALRGGYINVLITDAETGRGILRADGAVGVDDKPQPRVAEKRAPEPAGFYRTQVKKFLNKPNDVIEEMMDGFLKAHGEYIQPIDGSYRALVARDGPRKGKVGLVIGGGAGHEPCFAGYVGKGLADAVAVGNIFSSPPPDPIVRCAVAASGGAGVLFVYGNYAGDVMNFEMAAELAAEKGIAVRTVLTTDDVASSSPEDRDGRRGVAGNFFIFKIAGAAADRGLTLDACEAVTRKANARTYTIGVGLEPGSMPQTRRRNFEIGPDDIEIGMGIHGEPGVSRERMRTADEIVDSVMDKIFSELKAGPGEKVAVLVNSFGGTPMMELYILYRRVAQRLAAKKIEIQAKWVGHYCTSLDMVGASISVFHLDEELKDLLHHPCETSALRVN
ncbi:dihydroxyacetone kinase subunit DhaK [Neorhizobium sp. P12A]|uniref:bifunctional sugar-binding transcriptional regulator/dihydroxyacetone kinase subunit DhaK n=1 Tax=Neorhizobium sp. P12A TaxID=2268027 RepID=UPI0011EF6D32|nr:bifunctional sugar-binding transcriptional regulator/dihydroxyacetone kinase subunit DhaK [Neorhizobium sp. P12A]KAA0691937.1 dihydroxyacetone kinase subunit DhaK [Neorhizobium sp. P12A]